jgi:hypothetical protein
MCVIKRKSKANINAQPRGTTLQCGVQDAIEEAHSEQSKRSSENAKRDGLTTSMGRYFELIGG